MTALALKVVDLSLSRAHKVVQRFAALVAEKEAAVTGFTARAQLTLDETGARRLQSGLADAAAALEGRHEVIALRRVLTQMREVIGRSNGKEGIARNMAQQAALAQDEKLLSTLLDTLRITKSHQGADAEEFEKQAETAKRLHLEHVASRVPTPFTVGSVTAGFCTKAQFAAVEAELADVKAERVRLSDQQAELNQRRAQFEVPEAYLKALGL